MNWLISFLNRYVTWPVRQLIGGFWDWAYQVDTRGGVVSKETLGIKSEHEDKGVVYDPTPWSVIRSVAKLLPPNLTDFSFVDFGSGKGRVVLAAAALPYKSVIGVEYSPYLCDIANRNLKSQRVIPRRAKQVSIVCGDATEFRIPDGPCVLFFYNPFALPVIQRVLANIVASHTANPRQIYLVFFASSNAIADLNAAEAHLTVRCNTSIRCDLLYWRSVSIFQVA